MKSKEEVLEECRYSNGTNVESSEESVLNAMEEWGFQCFREGYYTNLKCTPHRDSLIMEAIIKEDYNKYLEQCKK